MAKSVVYYYYRVNYECIYINMLYVYVNEYMDVYIY